MEEDGTLLYTFLCILILGLATRFFFFFFLRPRKKFKNLPPSPPGLPIIGHLHLLKHPFHRTVDRLAQKYGPDVLSLKLGPQFAIVVSSSSAVEECFTKHDINFANRRSVASSKYLTFNNNMMVAASYGDHWRNLRRICNMEIFSSARLDMFGDIRRDEVKSLLGRVNRLSSSKKVVELRSLFFDLTSNNVMRMIAGKRYYGEEVDDRDEARELKDVLEEFFELSGKKRVADLFPILECFDFGGAMKNLANFSRKMDAFFQKLVDQHRDGKEERNSMIAHLLILQKSQPQHMTDEIIKSLVLVLLAAGTETVAASLEWAFATLLNHPEVLKKAKAEIDFQIGKDRLVDESDISRLHYIQSIISENLRLYPTIPALVPHLSAADCTVGGYHVPANTLLFVNAWGMHRDPKLWEDPESFKPERFENQSERGPKMIPFGLGRRACPGDGLAKRVMALTLASLLQCFDWEKIGEDKVDMTEKPIGKVLFRAQPLKLTCRPCKDLNFALP